MIFKDVLIVFAKTKFIERNENYNVFHNFDVFLTY